DARHLPRVSAHDGVTGRGQHPGQVAGDAAAGDVGQATDVDAGGQSDEGGGVDVRRKQQLVGQRVVGARPGRAVEVEAGDVEEDAPGQRVPVGAQAPGPEPDEAVAGLDAPSGDQPVALGDADREADQVELAG